MVPPTTRIRCVSTLSHIDHGKTTLTDRILELCGAVDPADDRALADALRAALDT